MSSDIVAIRVQNLGKCYHIYAQPQDRLKQSLWRGRKQFYREFWALKDVSFEMRKGETVGIIGRNGSGKSTLLQMIAGTLSPTSGSITVNGRVAALLELGSGFNPEFTGRENVYMNGAILGLSESEIAARFDEIANFADIGDFIEQPVKTYSSGMLMRLAFAVSVNVEPDVMIVDEALAVGDMAFQFKCMDRLERLTKSGTTLLFVSHDIGAIKAFCHRAIYLSGGEIKATGAASDIAELYMLDVKDEQKRALADGSAVTRKDALGSAKAIAFGTGQGKVVRAIFSDTESSQSAFSTGDTVNVEVDVEHDATLSNPAISIILCDYRMIELSGRYFRIEPKPGEGGILRATVRFSFRADMNFGNYFITVRLEERISDSSLMPVDKQVGALSFNVLRPANLHFIGMINLPIVAEQI
jgi:lipopolysaccharide transport system ATP-binding protein